MEGELRLFKEKIRVRFANREIESNYKFPRSKSFAALQATSLLFKPEDVYYKNRFKA